MNVGRYFDSFYLYHSTTLSTSFDNLFNQVFSHDITNVASLVKLLAIWDLQIASNSKMMQISGRELRYTNQLQPKHS